MSLEQIEIEDEMDGFENSFLDCGTDDASLEEDEFDELDDDICLKPVQPSVDDVADVDEFDMTFNLK